MKFYKKIRLNPDPDVFTLLVVVCIISLSLGFYNNYQIRNGNFVGANVGADGKKLLPVKDLIKNIKTDAPKLGNKDAKVVVVIFEDFQCPFCKKFETESYEKIKKDFVDTGKVLLVHQDLAFLGPESISAAEAANCALDQDKFWEYRKYVYDHQGDENSGALSDENLKKFATTLGLNRTQFDSCLDSGKYETKVSAERDFASSYGVGSTPTFVINGLVVRGARQYTDFSTIINNALNN